MPYITDRQRISCKKENSAALCCRCLVGDTDDTASRAETGVTGGGRELVATLSEVISASVDDDGASENTVGANQLDKAVLDAALGNTLGVGLDVSQVTDVADIVGGRTVRLAEGVEVRARRSAAVSVVAELVDVHAALGIGVRVLDLVLDHGGRALGLLRKLNDAGNAGITADDSNSFGHFDGELERRLLVDCCWSIGSGVRDGG